MMVVMLVLVLIVVVMMVMALALGIVALLVVVVVFTSWGVETANKYTKDEIEGILTRLNDAAAYGAILRAKGVVPGADGQWIHYDYVPEEHDVRTGPAAFTGRICVIGSKLNEGALKTLFRV